MSYRAYIIAFDPEHGTYTETEIMEGFATEQEAVDHARNRLPEVQQELAKLGENLLCSYRIRVVVPLKSCRFSAHNITTVVAHCPGECRGFFISKVTPRCY